MRDPASGPPGCRELVSRLPSIALVASPKTHALPSDGWEMREEVDVDDPEGVVLCGPVEDFVARIKLFTVTRASPGQPKRSRVGRTFGTHEMCSLQVRIERRGSV